jgi:hypothetical protein
MALRKSHSKLVHCVVVFLQSPDGTLTNGNALQFIDHGCHIDINELHVIKQKMNAVVTFCREKGSEHEALTQTTLTNAALVRNEGPAVEALITLVSSDTRQALAFAGVWVTCGGTFKLTLTGYN